MYWKWTLLEGYLVSLEKRFSEHLLSNELLIRLPPVPSHAAFPPVFLACRRKSLEIERCPGRQLRFRAALAQLHNRLEEDDRESLLLVCGIGGVGKSQLVLNYIREYRRDYAAVFWIEAGKRETIERDFLQIHRLLFGVQPGSGQDNMNVENAVLAVKDWFPGNDRRWLVVFDSADAIDNEEDDLYIDIKYFIPDDPSVHFIVTTRSATVREMTDLEAVKVADMDGAEAAELFIKYMKKRDILPEMTAEIDLLVGELGHLALAITLAGAYISATPRLRSDIKLYLPEYRRRRKELLSQKPNRMIHQYKESVLTTWEMTFSGIASQSRIASRFLTLLAFVHFGDIFMELFGRATITGCSAGQVGTEGSEAVWTLMISSEEPVDLYTVEAAFRSLDSYALVQWKPD